jgi:uncharacterized protein YigA (DUF484 family)
MSGWLWVISALLFAVALVLIAWLRRDDAALIEEQRVLIGALRADLADADDLIEKQMEVITDQSQTLERVRERLVELGLITNSETFR